jgi:hypothetical protein
MNGPELDREAAPPASLTGAAERERVLSTLRAHAGELRRRGLARLRLFGSVARGEANRDSDVDLIAEIDRGRVERFSLLDLIRVEDELSRLIGRKVEITTAPDKMIPWVKARLERDAVGVF